MSDVRLYMEDCLTLLPTLETGSVSAVVTDPPYGQTNEKYDNAIAFSATVWRECYRVAAKNAALLSFAGSPTYHRIASAIEAGGWIVRQMWAWVYRDGLITSAWPKEGFDRLAPAMDPIVYATKGKVLLGLKRQGDGEWERRGEWTKRRRDYSGRSGVLRAAAIGHWPRSIASDGSPPFEYFDLPRGGRKPDGASGHPNQKPLALMRWLLSKLPPGGAVLDPFAGSGTTLIAAMEGGRDAIGCEVDAEFYRIAEKRIAEAQAATPLYAEAE